MMKKFISLLLVLFMFFTSVVASYASDIDDTQKIINSFSDLKGHWAEKPVAELVSKGIINGYPDGTFRPDASISVAEFTTLLLKIMNIPIEKDTEHKEWYMGVVNTARKYGLIKRDEFGNYNNPITRGEIARMTIYALQDEMKEYNRHRIYYANNEVIRENFLEDYTDRLNKLGIIGGYPDATLGVDKQATRAETAVMLLKIAELAKNIELKPIENFVNPDLDVPQRLYNYPMDGVWKGGADPKEIVAITEKWLPILYGRDYTNLDGYKEKLRYHIACERTFNGKWLKADQWMDAYIQEAIDNKIIQESYFITAEDLAYRHNSERGQWIRGTLRFIYHSHDNPPEGVKVGQWYEQDMDIRWIWQSKDEEDYWDTHRYLYAETKVLSDPIPIENPYQ